MDVGCLKKIGNSQGQVFVEWIVSLSVVLILGVVGGGLLWRSWNQFHCTYAVFEAAHASLIHLARPKTRLFIQIHETDQDVEATAKCVFGMESVRLPKLETAHW
jgi:hypothetical protein